MRTRPPDPSASPRETRRASFHSALDDLAVDPVARRDFLTRMGAALALAGIGACTRAPSEEIVPYVTQPPEVRPGTPSHYATASVLDGYATGIVVESHTGRPTKVEGNPAHPASLGAAGVFEQASVLSLYDPARARGVKRGNDVVDWDELRTSLTSGRWIKEAGRGLHLHLERTSSPTVMALLDRVRERYPHVTVSWQPTSITNAWEGARLAFGSALEPRYALDRADVVLVLDADLLASGPASLRYARQFAEKRAQGLRASAATMSRLYVVEPLVTVTGLNADHRLRVRADDVGAIAAAIASNIGLPALQGGVPATLAAHADSRRRWIDAVARDLTAHRGRSLVVVGDAQPPHVHALAHAMNAVLGNVGATVTYAASPIAEAGTHTTALGDVLAKTDVDTLVVCAQNPVFKSPRSAELVQAMGRVRLSAYVGEYDDETAAASSFTVARAHALESWGDARAFDGTLSIVQPLIEPLSGGRSELEVLALLAGSPSARAHDLVKEQFRVGAARGGLSGEAATRSWRAALRDGLVSGSAFPAVRPNVDWKSLGDALSRAASAVRPAIVAPDALELVSRLDPRVHDGRFANNAWLLELPSPTTKLTWSNAATFSVANAAKLGIETGDDVELALADGAAVTVPACIVAGQTDGTVGLTLGWGRTRGAPLAQERGVNAYALAGRGGVSVRKTGSRRKLPITQQERGLKGRDGDILHHGTLDALRAQTGKSGERKRQLTLYDVRPGAERQWGMSIDLTRCIGCEACVIACQAENNVPTVGADNVILNREMHWLRVDSYVVGDPEDPTYAVQPMLCQHCEKAPCEYVCPVNATVHSPDGLNEMVYNRCVGTRFCSNNCPYKVRRFNWFDFHSEEDARQQLVHNPDVTVRQRGVMEKCTFCVQRLREWEIKEQQGRPSRAPRTACEQTCPTGAIVFGDLRAPGSEVQRLHEDPRAFGALDEALGTEPRVRYLARVRNPNPELA